MSEPFNHTTVLLNEAVDGLCIKPDGIYVDGTVGGAGHSKLIASRLTDGRLIALDRDPTAVKEAERQLQPYPHAKVIKCNYSLVKNVLNDLGIDYIDGLLLDLGVSSYQLDTIERGFSFHNEAELDMRMSDEGITAAEMVNTLEAKELTRILYEFGEEKFAPQITRGIVKYREQQPIRTTTQLAEIISQSVPAVYKKKGHPSRKTFQALRIAVNSELDELIVLLDEIFDKLNKDGRLSIITFHSLEDRIVKRAFTKLAQGCECPPRFPVCVCGKTPKAEIITKKPIVACSEELQENNRSRSAKLRILKKL